MPTFILDEKPQKFGRPPLHARYLPHGNLAQDLTTCYLFNSHPSNYLIDVSPFRHNSSRIQNLSNDYWLPVEDGRALFLFEGAAQRVDCGFIPKLNGSRQATIAAWVKRHNISSRSSVGKGGFNLDFLDDGWVYMGMDGVYSRFELVESTPAWQHIVFVFDASLPNASRVLGYRNGIPQTMDMNGTLPNSINADLFNFFYINYSTEFGVYGSSYYKFAAIWNRALDYKEIQELYTDQQFSWLTQEKMLYRTGPLSQTSEDDDEIDVESLIDCNFILECR